MFRSSRFSKTVALFLIILSYSIFLVSDNYPGEQIFVSTPTLRGSRVAETCELLGCNDWLWVDFMNYLPNHFVMELHDDYRRVMFIEVMDYLKMKEEEKKINARYTTKRFDFSDPELASVPEALRLLERCPTPTGSVELVYIHDFLASILVQCFHPPVMPFFGTRVISFEDYKGISLVIDGYAPRKLLLRMTWGDQSYEKIFEPDYYIYQPNGSGCEPTCASGTIQLELP